MKKTGIRQAAVSAALLALLAASGYAGANRSGQVQTVSAPIVFESLEEGDLAAVSVETAGNSLASVRAQALALLEEVLADPRASQEAISRAHEEKTQMSEDMESEARIEAALDAMGIGGVKAVSGEGVMMVIAPPDAALDSKVRMQIVDTALSATGLDAEDIKIILAKNE